MATKEDFFDYPKGRFALGPGDLIDVVDVNLAFEDGETVVSTLRANPSGSYHGKKSVKATFKSAISHLGFERDWMGLYLRRDVVEGRLKVPGLTFIITGRLTTPGLTTNVDNMIELSKTIIGRWRTSPV